jgi:hypothetical protein
MLISLSTTLDKCYRTILYGKCVLKFKKMQEFSEWLYHFTSPLIVYESYKALFLCIYLVQWLYTSKPKIILCNSTTPDTTYSPMTLSPGILATTPSWFSWKETESSYLSCFSHNLLQWLTEFIIYLFPYTFIPISEYFGPFICFFMYLRKMLNLHMLFCHQE